MVCQTCTVKSSVRQGALKALTVPRLSCRPAAGCRAREDAPGAKQGAGARAAADVLHQPGAAAGDRGKGGVLFTWLSCNVNNIGLFMGSFLKKMHGAVQ